MGRSIRGTLQSDQPPPRPQLPPEEQGRVLKFLREWLDLWEMHGRKVTAEAIALAPGTAGPMTGLVEQVKVMNRQRPRGGGKTLRGGGGGGPAKIGSPQVMQAHRSLRTWTRKYMARRTEETAVTGVRTPMGYQQKLPHPASPHGGASF